MGSKKEVEGRKVGEDVQNNFSEIIKVDAASCLSQKLCVDCFFCPPTLVEEIVGRCWSGTKSGSSGFHSQLFNYDNYDF